MLQAQAQQLCPVPSLAHVQLPGGPGTSQRWLSEAGRDAVCPPPAKPPPPPAHLEPHLRNSISSLPSPRGRAAPAAVLADASREAACRLCNNLLSDLEFSGLSSQADSPSSPFRDYESLKKHLESILDDKVRALCGAFPALVWSYAWALHTSLLIPPSLSPSKFSATPSCRTASRCSGDSSRLGDYTGAATGSMQLGNIRSVLFTAGRGRHGVTCFEGQNKKTWEL